jgi:hypothetical protein
MACRRCSECEWSVHHWMENGDFGADDEDPDYLEDEHRSPTGNMYICKHCPAVGDDCELCDGSGEVESASGAELPCFGCGGDGIVEVQPRKFADLDLDGDSK